MSLVTFADSGNLDKQPEVKGADLCITASYGNNYLQIPRGLNVLIALIGLLI